MSRLSSIIAPLLALLAIGGFAAGEQETPLFERDVLPLLEAKCGHCHSGPVREGDLDLSSLASLRQGGESGENLLADRYQESLLWQVLSDGVMPPEGEPGLSDSQIAIIRRWLEAGMPATGDSTASATRLNQHDVLPIFLLRCAACHGARLQRGGLDLRGPESILAGGQSGPALVAGDPDASLLVRRIESQACPPGDQLLKYFVRRPPQSEVELIRQWIAEGAFVELVEPDVATRRGDPLVSDLDRQHWAFQPPSKQALHHSIDPYIAAQFSEHGLSWSEEASRETLIRRVYLDLIGLPPTVAELRRWRESDSRYWYETMVDQLLASPRYGERWGRYWLDLAGYADSEGGISADPIRPAAWKYRDYVIAAFNRDKPYDRFLFEQLAGDELFNFENPADVTDEAVECLVATGFLRMGIDETGSRTMNFVPERLKVIDDALSVVSGGLMGLTMECARCHSHKYDPIPHRDYYRFKAIFQGALDEYDWDSFKTRRLDIATLLHRQRMERVNPPLQAQIKQLESKIKSAQREVRRTLLRHHYLDYSERDIEATLAALNIADNNRTLPQKALVEQLQSVELLADEQQPVAVVKQREQIASWQRERELIRRQLVPTTDIRALWDRGRPSPVYVLIRGEHDQPGRLVGPGVPAVLTDGRTPFEVGATARSAATTGRRLAFVRWLTRPDHPLTARVMVNRIWRHHFGTGLVASLDNFGVAGERPSHPDLLDWLAVEFVRGGWSVKHMHRLILNSRVYRQSSRVSEIHQKRDPQNRWLSRFPLRRMDAESLRDSLLLIAGQLDESPGGLPDAVTVDREGSVTANPTAGGGWRRSVYLQFRRTEIPTMMDTFDYPQMGPNCLDRDVSVVSPQALLLMNSARIRHLAAAMAAQIEIESHLDAGRAHEPVDSCELHKQRIRRVYERSLSRLPNDRELALGVRTLATLVDDWNGDQQRALETYCHTVLNSAAFVYID